MAAPKPLTHAQSQELHADLLALCDELEASAKLTAAGAKPVDLDEPIGRLSRMEARQQQEMVIANRKMSEARLRLAHVALKKDFEDEYGECQSCEEAIGYARLKARPETALCLGCKQSREG